MIESKRIRARLSPRSGLGGNSPALQCWVPGELVKSKPVKRATENTSLHAKLGKLLSSALRTMNQWLGSFPSDESLGYFRSSASRTEFVLGFSITLVVAFTNSQASAQTAVLPSPTPPTQQTLKVPPVADGFRANAAKPLPALSRVGVDANEQRPLTLREAIAMALRNNKDIEVARDSVSIAEADLLSARGAYDPRFSAQSYYEKIKTPAASFLSGAGTAVETGDVTATSRLEGLAPKAGGNYRLDFSSVRATSNSLFTALNPQYPTLLTFTFTQPLMRGRRIDLPRRQIEVAKKNLSLTDAQFRQRAIEVITSVQRSYWDLVFALRNLQIQ